jgi:hypothetical protein
MEQAGLLGTDNFLGDLAKHKDTVKNLTLNLTQLDRAEIVTFS